LITIKKHEDEVTEALYKDFKKPPFETFLTEINYVISDLKYTISNIEKLGKTKTRLGLQ